MTTASSSIERRLPSTIAVVEGTPVGRSMDAVTTELSAGLRALDPVVSDDCTTRSFVGADGGEVFHRQTCSRFDVIRVGYRGPNDIDKIYGDHADGDKPKDGRVDGYSQKSGDFLSVEDQNRDGKVDIQIVKADPNTSLEPFGNYRLTQDGKLANRILSDTDFNGHFDVEALTADSASRSWFLRDE